MKKLNYFIFTLFFMLIICGKVYAANTPYWFEDNNILRPTQVEFYNINSSGFSSVPISSFPLIGYDDKEYYFFTNDNPLTIASNGIGFRIPIDPVENNYFYNATFYICSPNSYLPDNFTINVGESFISSEPSYSYNAFFSLNTLPYGDNVTQACKSYSSNFVADRDGYYLSLTLRSPSVNRVGNFWLMGYTIENLGQTTEHNYYQIETALKNSGFATANSVSELQDSVEQVQEELNGVNSSIEEQTQQQQQNHEETMDTITSSDVDSPDNAFSEFESYLPENGVITELITLPISLFQRVLTSINGSCSSYNLGNLMGTDLILPCINISNYIGTTLWNVIDILFSGFFVLVIGKKMIKVFNNFTSMEEGDVLD